MKNQERIDDLLSKISGEVINAEVAAIFPLDDKELKTALQQLREYVNELASLLRR